jgi:hypothetical protein
MDPCADCSLKDDLKCCEQADCSVHNSWFAQELSKKIKYLEEEITAVYEREAGASL